MYMNHSHDLHTRGDYISDKQIEEHLARWWLYDTDRVQTISHVLQIDSPGFKYTHQQLKFTINIQAYYQEAMEKKDPLVFLPSMEAADFNRPQQFVVLIKQLTFSENMAS